MNTVITVKDLHKTYKPKRGQQSAEVRAVDGISFAVVKGEFFGLLGPNGAGKTTTIGILTTRVRPTGGEALIDSINEENAARVSDRGGQKCAGRDVPPAARSR